MTTDFKSGPQSAPLSTKVENGESARVGSVGGYAWITDIPAPEEFDAEARKAIDELPPLAELWLDQMEEFDQEQRDTFNRELKREWALETGLIERVYHWDRGITRLFIEEGVKAELIPSRNGQDPAQVLQMVRDHENVFEGLFDFVAGRRELTVGYVKHLHSEITRSQKAAEGVDKFGVRRAIPLHHGQFKQRPNNPTTVEGVEHKYCPYEHVASEMDKLITMHKAHDGSSHSPLARAAWLHHRFTQIHPFEDGNGRVARCLSTLVFIREKWVPLVVTDDEAREKYLNALGKADNGDLSMLICCFAEWQKRYFDKALGIAGRVRTEVLRKMPLDKRIDSLADLMKHKGRRQGIEREEKHAVALRTAGVLYDLACERLQSLAERVDGELGDNGKAWSNSGAKGDHNGDYFQRQMVQTAKALDYYANAEVHRAWVRLVLQVGDERAMLLLFFHGVGRPYQGVAACAACFVIMRRRTSEDDKEGVGLSEHKRGEWWEDEPVPLGGGTFRINYKEEEAQATKRFESWLDGVIGAAVEMAFQEF